MYFALFAFPLRPMSPTACYRLCRDFAWAGIFARRVRSSALTASVMDFARYRLLLGFFNVKPFSFIRSMDIRSSLLRQIIYKFRADVSLCKTPATNIEKPVSPLSE